MVIDEENSGESFSLNNFAADKWSLISGPPREENCANNFFSSIVPKSRRI